MKLFTKLVVAISLFFTASYQSEAIRTKGALTQIRMVARRNTGEDGSSITFKPAMVASITSGLFVQTYSEKPKNIRVNDQLVFIRRTGNMISFTGYGKIFEVNEPNTLAKLGRPWMGIQPGDEVYIINRDNSVYSLAKAIFPKGVNSIEPPKPEEKKQ